MPRHLVLEFAEPVSHPVDCDMLDRVRLIAVALASGLTRDVAGGGVDLGRRCRAQRQSSSGSNVWRRYATTIASSASVSTVERASVGPVFLSSTVARLRHFATVLGLMPNPRLSCASEACDRYIAALTACVVVVLP